MEKMKLYSIKIGNKEFKVAPVGCAKKMKKGLSGSEKLKEGKGMLFNFREPRMATMNMQNMNYSIDMIFIDADMEVTRVSTRKPGSADISESDTLYVVEVNAGEGHRLRGKKVVFGKALIDIMEEHEEKHEEKQEHREGHNHAPGVNIIIKIETVPQEMKERFKNGGTINLIEEDVKAIHNKMQVLDDEGKVLMNISGGERIFSIGHTQKLVSLAESVKAGEVSPEELGKAMKEILTIQNTQDPQYV